jgi:transcriptional regulator of acetoin/glycerol metabolism
VLQEREVTPLGGRKAFPVDFALISASHRDLLHMMTKGEFRADLFYRIAQSILPLPPFRERKDREALVRKLWISIGAERTGVALTPGAVADLARHDWPGNVRQLVSVLKMQLALASPNSTIDVCDLRFDSPLWTPSPPSATQRPQPAAAGATLDEIEKRAIAATLDQCGGNVSAAARKLGISRSTLHRYLTRMAVADP